MKRKHNYLLTDNRLKIYVIHIKIPEGRGSRSHTTYRNKEDAFKNKKSVIAIRNDDNLYLGRAIFTAIERCKHLAKLPNKYQMCKNANTGRREAAKMVLKLEAKKLHALAKVPTDGGCSIEELKKFQKAIKDFQIVVFSLQSKEELLFKGPEKSRKIYLILDEETKHYNVISGPKAFFGYQSYCETCNKPYKNRYEHSCEVKCFRCSGNHNPTDHLDMISCDDCFLDFYGQECFDIHKSMTGNQKKSICLLYRKCPLCGIPGRTSAHKCGIRCKKCHVHHAKDVEHQCFMKPKKIKNNDNQKLIFFDIESQFVHSQRLIWHYYGQKNVQKIHCYFWVVR